MKQKKFIGEESIEFDNFFTEEKDCYEYLASIKWSDGNFCCTNLIEKTDKICGYTGWSFGKNPPSRRCNKCRYDESPRVNTMFNNRKFPLLKAFRIIFDICTKKDGLSVLKISNDLKVEKRACLAFRLKVQQAMKNSEHPVLNGVVQVADFSLLSLEELKRLPSMGKRHMALLILERLEGGNVGSVYIETVKYASAECFRPFFKKYINENSEIITNRWTGYLPLKDEFPHIEQIQSKDEIFSDLDKHILEIKTWLKKTQDRCDWERVQGYLDEYHYIFNRRNNKKDIFHSVIEEMVKNKFKGEFKA